jgi:hypothetical protein
VKRWRSAWALGVMAMLGGAGVGLRASDTAATPKTGDAAESQDKAQPQRLREGTRLVNEAGTFRATGDRVAFYPAGQEKSQSFLVLENLALERIARTLDETRGQQEWSVTGIVNEYRGRNYLYVTRAIERTRRNSAWTAPGNPGAGAPGSEKSAPPETGPR